MPTLSTISRPRLFADGVYRLQTAILGGGVEVRNLLQFTAILLQFFSDASVQKFQFSPEEQSFSLFAVARHTVRFCVLICPSYHLCGWTLFCFCVPKMSSTFGDSDSGKGKRSVKPILMVSDVSFEKR